MIYLLSDIHGGESIDGLNEYLSFCTDSDLLIILGDIGMNFDMSEENKAFTEWFLSLKTPIAFIDGNHENHPYINSFPNDIWCGGEVHRLSDYIVHLKRGNIYIINDKSFFVMGGCKSSGYWKELGLWYDGEEPNEAELTLAYNNLQKLNNNVDFVLTHKYENYKKSDIKYSPFSLEGLIKKIDEDTTFTHWYSGHWHNTEFIDKKHTIVYDKPIKIL